MINKLLVTCRAIPALAVCALLLGVTGCSDSDPIRRYTVTRPGAQDRMLAAIVPGEQKDWFFKVAGPNEQLQEQAAPFAQFVESIYFEDEQPAWDLPPSWTSEEGSGMRFATIRIPAEGESLELSVTALPRMASEQRMVLDNINRWRQQLGLPPISSSQLSEEATQLQLAKAPQRTATMVNMAGNLSGGDGGAGQAAPFAGGGAGRGGAGQAAPFAGGGAGQSGRQAMPSSGGATEPAIEYDTPEGWQDGELVVSRGGIQIERAAAFEIVDGSQQAEVTVTSLPARAANIMNNVNRWRGQVQLEPWSEQELQEEMQPFSVGDAAGTYVELIGPEQAILGIIALDNGTGWFIKLQGHHDVAVGERERFKQFARSIKFSGEQHE